MTYSGVSKAHTCLGLLNEYMTLHSYILKEYMCSAVQNKYGYEGVSKR